MYFSEPLDSMVVEPSGHETATVIFLHGASTDGLSMCQQLVNIYGGKEFFLPQVKYLFPTSKNRTVDGEVKRTWFDRKELALDSEELFDTIDPPCQQIHQIIKNELIRGINSRRIFIGGYSLGGALALLYVYRYLVEHDAALQIGGAFVLSAFLNSQSDVYTTMDEALANNRQFSDLFYTHGCLDDVVDFTWALDTVKRLKMRNVLIDFEVFEQQDHDFNKEQLERLKIWLNRRLQ